MYLFVYGTLRKTPSAYASSTHFLYLQDAIFCSTAKVKGKLYSLGDYPGLILDETGQDQVIGEIYTITDDCLDRLDEYEEIIPDNPQNQYQRICLSIVADNQQTYESWVYVLQKNPENSLQIISGDWCN